MLRDTSAVFDKANEGQEEEVLPLQLEATELVSLSPAWRTLNGMATFLFSRLFATARELRPSPDTDPPSQLEAAVKDCGV